MTSPVYACVWVRRFCTQAVLRVRPELRDRAIAVLEGERPSERLCCMNLAAHTFGAQMGMTRAEAELTGAELIPRSQPEESSARNALLDLLHRYTPRVEDASRGTHCVLVMDLEGTGRIFGTPRLIAEHVLQQARTIGLRANIAISANFETAVAIASCARESIVEVQPGNEAGALAPLTLAALPADDDTLAIFHLWGLRTFGDLAALPRAQLVSRLGTKADALLELARGERAHLFLPAESVAELSETIRFDDPIELLEPLLFVLNALLEQLLLRAIANLDALASVTVTLALDGGGKYERRVRPALPTQDRGLLLKLLQLDLGAHPPPAGVISVFLLGETGHTSKTQLGLFSPQHPEPMRMEVTLARIAAMVGEDNIGNPRLKDTHRDGVFRMDRFPSFAKKNVAREDGSSSPALRRLRPPIEVAAQNRVPDKICYAAVTYDIRRLYGPWRSSGAWWSSDVWACESWDFAAECGSAVLLGVLTHDRLRRTWHLDALYD